MLGRRNGITQDGSKAPNQKQRPRVEALERRALLATITVKNTNDSGPGSLRDAINQVDQGSATAGNPDTINFGLAGDVNVIALQTQLPTITRPVIINGPTQSASGAVPGGPALLIDGSKAALNNGAGANGLVLQGPGGSRINNLAIGGFNNPANGGGRGILVQDGGGDNFTNNYLGLGVDSVIGQIDGQTADANVIGIEVRSANNVIGPGANATTATQGNVISGNSYDGILIGGANATGNTVVGNKIGTDRTGIYGVGNLHGVEIYSATGNTIGGTTAASRNTISGNVGVPGALGSGILFTGTASGDVVAGNNIGTDPSGTAYVGNTFGISLGQPVRNNTTDQISNITVGGTATGAGNVISGNGTAIYGAATKSTILGNMIGADATGTRLITFKGAPVGNGYGILLGGTGNTIGGTTAAARNVIVGSGTVGTPIDNDYFFGTALDLTGASFVIQGNAIGLGLNGQPLPNRFGIYLNAAGSTIGGTAAGAGNVIGGNINNGITLTGLANNTIQGNLIGNLAGGALGNGANGIGVLLFDPNTTTAANDILTLNDTIGGTVAGAANIIAGNGQNGVAVSSTYGGIAGLLIRGNSISGNGGLGISTGPVVGVPQPSSLTIAAATSNGTTSAINGIIGGAPGQTYIIDLYSSAQADPSGFGEGQTYLGAVTTKVGPAGIATFTAYPPVPLGANSVVTATYTPVSSTGITGSTSDFSASFPNSTPRANLVLVQQATASTNVGGNVTITATVTNTGTGTARNVAFVDALDGTLVNASASATTGSAFLGPANVVYAALGNLAPGASATVTITAGTTASAAIANAGGVVSDSPESSYADNVVGQTILVNPAVRPTADLAIAVTPTTTTPTVGTPLVFVVTVANLGPNSASNVTVTDFFPNGLFLINSAVSQGGPITAQGGVVQANLGTLAPGGFAQILLNVLPASAGSFTLPVNVASNLLDPVTGNNSASATVTASAPAAASNAVGSSTSGSGTGGTVAADGTTAAQGPTVAGVTGSRSNAQLKVAFSAPITKATATSKANYLLYDLGTAPRALSAADRPIAITSVFRDAAGTGVTLTPSRAIRANQYYTLVVVGSTGRGIVDTSGRKLAGSGGVAGTDSTTTFLAGGLTQA